MKTAKMRLYQAFLRQLADFLDKLNSEKNSW